MESIKMSSIFKLKDNWEFCAFILGKYFIFPVRISQSIPLEIKKILATGGGGGIGDLILAYLQ